jgi:hypothetical protein
MAKGLFSQGVSLLTDGRTRLDDIRAVLRQQGFEVVKEFLPQEHWAFGGHTLLIPFLPEVNGYAAVDLVNQVWPDSMGDPKSDATTFGAWSMGHFGPLAFPGSLARARQHSWSWEGGRTIPEGHRGLIRVRMSYVFGAKRSSPILPADYDPVAEMMFLSRTVLALLKAPGVLCYFNPNGEVLSDHRSFREVWDACAKEEALPLPLWMNIRFFNLDQDLGFMDTVGNGQVEIRDVEAIFPKARYGPGEIDYYLRNVTHYLLGLDREIKTGQPIDGPGENNLSWILEVLDEGLVDPPRHVLRLYPKTSSKAIRQALSALPG